MKSNYGLYLEEREGIEIIENGRGFITYSFTKNNELMVHDCFIKKEYRNCGIAKRWFIELENIAKESNCKSIVTTTDKETNGWELSTKMLEDFKYRIECMLDNNKIIFLRKEL